MVTPADAATDDKPTPTGIPARIAAIVAWVTALKPVRVFMHYAAARGPILSSGLAFQAIFATFAAIWVAFSVAGLFLSSNPDLQDSLFSLISTSVPGLIDTGSGGAIDPADLLETGVLGWTGALALVGLLGTALGWLASGRDAVRSVFGLPALAANFVLLKLKDLGLALGFGVALIVSAALSVFSTAALDVVFRFLGVSEDSLLATIVGRTIGLALVLALDTFVLASFFRIVSGIQIPFRRLLGGALIGGAALGVLKALGSTLLGGASSNPLLASFAVIIGLLIWFNLICQVILISAAWIAVGMTDAGEPIDPKAEAERRAADEAARAAAAAIAEANRPRGLARLFRRR